MITIAPEMIGQTISHYHILSLLGEGGMGAVYVAEDTRLGRRVAVKIPREAPGADNSFHARFLREARSISQLSHPNIATVFDYGETPDGHPFIVMELVEGRELGELLREGGLTLQRAVQIVCEVGEALSEAHLRGVIHRDVKPSNVIVNSRGGVKVLDFGLAKIVSEGRHTNLTSADETLMKFRTRSDVLLGTPLYLSPEQAKGVEVDPRSDLFALGALLYECVAGRPAFSGATVMEIAGQVIHVDPPPPSHINRAVPAELDRVTMKALSKRPEDRYQSAGEMVEDLRRLAPQFGTNGGAQVVPSYGGHTVSMAPPVATDGRASMIMTISENLRRPRLSLAAVLGVLVVVLGGVWGVSRMLRPTAHVPKLEAAMQAEQGAAEMRDGAFWHASKTLESAVKVDDKYPLAYARLAEALMEQDRGEKAKDMLLRVRQLVPDPSILPDRDRLYLDAVMATATRDFATAVTAYEQIARRWPEAPAYVDLGRAYERREQEGDLDKAIDAYLEATKRDDGYATAFLRVGSLYARDGQRDAALSSYKRAEEIYNARGLPEGRAEVHFRRGLLLRNRGELDAALEQLRQALGIASTNGYESMQIVVLLQLSAIGFEQNDPEAKRYAQEAAELADAADLENLLALSLVSLGSNYFRIADYKEGEKYMRQGLAVAERNGAHRVRANALVNIGSMYIHQGRADEGLPLVEQALAAFQSSGYRKEIFEATVAYVRGLRQKGNYAEGLKILGKQLETAKQIGDLSQVARAHAEIGSVLMRQEDFPNALKRFDESYELEKSLGHEVRAAYQLVSRADALWSLGRHQQASTLLGEATKVAQKPVRGNKDLLLNIHLTAAKVALSQLRMPDAKAEAEQALKLAGEGNKRLAPEALLVLALAQIRAGSPAVPACEAALAAAAEVKDPALVSAAQLALAEARLRAGQAQQALSDALRAREAFAQVGETESEWRAWLVAAGASRQVKDEAAARQHAEHAAAALTALTQKWGLEAFESYQSRPDVQTWLRQLHELTGARPAG